jgi:hypothetical protein
MMFNVSQSQYTKHKTQNNQVSIQSGWARYQAETPSTSLEALSAHYLEQKRVQTLENSPGFAYCRRRQLRLQFNRKGSSSVGSQQAGRVAAGAGVPVKTLKFNSWKYSEAAEPALSRRWTRIRAFFMVWLANQMKSHAFDMMQFHCIKPVNFQIKGSD